MQESGGKMNILKNVPKLYQKNSENYELCGCFLSILQYLQEDNFDYTLIAGITGDIFTQEWLCAPQFGFGGASSHNLATRAAQLVFEACGYQYELVERADIVKNEAVHRQMIIDSLTRGLPVIGRNLTSDYKSFGLIIGCDKNTDQYCLLLQDSSVLLEGNPLTFYDGILAYTDRLIYFGKKTKTPPLEETIRKAINRIPALYNMQKIGLATYGRQALSDWAACLRGETYSEEKNKAIADDHTGIWIAVATNYGHTGYSGYACEFLERAKSVFPHCKDMFEEAISCFRNINTPVDQLMNNMNNLEENMRSRVFRSEMASYVETIGTWYEKAVSALSNVDI
jgi:hypothetical protein